MDNWQTISIKPLSGNFNNRARPSDLAPGEFRWKQNLAMNSTGRLSRRDGFQRFGLSSASDFEYANQDHHYRGRARRPITFGFESTSSDGTRRLFDGTDQEVSVLDLDAGLWTDLATGLGGTGARWKAAELQDVVIFTNNVDTIRSHSLGTAEFDDIPELGELNVTKARIVVQFGGFILLMNVEQDGDRFTSRVMWGDINGPLHYYPGRSYGSPAVDSLAGFQDLDYGDDIIAAAQLGGSLMIYTKRSIWRCYVSAATPDAVFGFQKVYSEPENQKGCIVYPNTLVNLGDMHVYASRDDFYVFSPYYTKPKNLEEWEWLHNATGLMFDSMQHPSYALDPDYCESPVAKFVPVRNEIWISWPSVGTAGINNHTLVANTVYRTADYVDHGFTMFVNNRQTPETSACNETQVFIGASSTDYALKAIGNAVFKRELIALEDEDPTIDISLDGVVYYDEGYNSVVSGLLPLGFPDDEKIVKDFLLEHDTVAQAVPCLIKLRIGNSYNVADTMLDDGTCAPQWKVLSTKQLACPGSATVSKLAANNQRPNLGLDWQFHYLGRYLYFELTVFGKTGPAVGGDSAWSKIDVKAMTVK
jgi:hypothetical protein